MSPQCSDTTVPHASHPTPRTEERIVVNPNNTSPKSPVRSVPTVCRVPGPLSPPDTLFPPFRPDFRSPETKPATHPTQPQTPSIPAKSPPNSNHGISDATRIRDNQRRSRARRAEYVRELEAKVRAYEKEGVQATAEVQASARRVVEENGLLRQEVRGLREEMGRLREKNAGEDDERTKARLGLSGRKVDGKRKRLIDNNNDNINEARRKKSKTIMCGFGGLSGCSGLGCENTTHSTTSKETPIQYPTPSPSTSASPRSSFAAASALFRAPSPAPSTPHSGYHPASPSTPRPCPSSWATQTQPPSPATRRGLPPFGSSSYPSAPNSSHPHPTATHAHISSTPSLSTARHTRSPTPFPVQDSDTDTSSCHLAAQIITSMRSDVSPEQIRYELGCPSSSSPSTSTDPLGNKQNKEGNGDCKVRNQKLLSLMDRLA
ncbi:MAG: hypothetical protein Q9223_006001 [Gallowayella weberi]